MKPGKFLIDRSDQAYPKIRRSKGSYEADNVNYFNTLGEAKRALLSELVYMKEHYQGLIDDVRKTTIKQLDDEAYPNLY